MKINLNNLPYTKPIISRKAILSKITEWDIYKRYIHNDIKLKQIMSSPFREDNIPSFGLYKNDEGKILYNDFVLGGGNCFQLVKYLFNYNNWLQVYSRIAIDFWIDNEYYCDLNTKDIKSNIIPNKGSKPSIKENLKLNVSKRQWNHYDATYWSKYGISKKTLINYNVFPIDYIIFKSKYKNRIIKTDTYAYTYIEKKDNEITYKIYQPFSIYKWFGNVNNSIWQGWNQLPPTGDTLIITKSLKDVMSIVENCNIPAISLQNEKIKPKINVINDLKKRFKHIYILYDNDFDKSMNYGQVFAHEICDEFDLVNIKIPITWRSKDFTDLVKNEGKEVSKMIIYKLIENKKNKNNKIPF